VVALATAGTGAGRAGRAAPRVCTTAQLKITLARSLVAAGTVGGYIGLRNRGRAACRLSGWPGLVLVDRAGAATSAVRVRSTMFGPRPTLRGVPVATLRHGELAEAVFAGGDIPPPGEARCPGYRRLRVTPPGSSHAVTVSAWLPALGALMPACTRIAVTMVVPARDLDNP
jgi:hypothetical protein